MGRKNCYLCETVPEAEKTCFIKNQTGTWCWVKEKEPKPEKQDSAQT